ncbi:ferric-chelate reductase-like protein [Dothidotthia symphoricarpi CBS 119687]|uniref:Ferric-chelate reductase-like protein n=1 Tax=Dothidotthia symphoricarpi CBS 119687 TaxID=1392245 RepID=A0A6A6A061_9PLEO|nr:ferric-chelate reductase-like protein [Dothidotthia symphoricarpi CBS 119687]KAF2124078.1 ferric-chelate reductase-like protein [Dothidotthia symphoricarpi CBS 119687]
MSLTPRHIQNLSEAAGIKDYWGYVERAVPCTNDPGSCAYLDVVYHSHELGMLYSGILWATIGGILLSWAIGRHFFRSEPSGVQLPVEAGEQVNQSKSTLARLQQAIPSYLRRYLLPDAARSVFGRVNRTQVLTLVVLTGYLAIFSFVGIVYDTWITPVKKSPGVYNTRTSLGPWADRVGVLAYALTPLSIMLASRESILSLVTGLPYQSFNFLHRWLGYIIFAQSVLHTIGWTVIEVRLYQPQPTVAIAWITQLYMIWGIVAMILLLLMVVLSTPWGIRLTGYEFFRKFHYLVAMIYIGACWGHWAQLKVFLLPGLIVWFLDRAARGVRTALLHYNFLPSGHMGFRAAPADIMFFEDETNGDVVRLDFDHPHDAWDVGQHFYLMFPESSIWQSHPFTPLSLPVFGADSQRHSYIFRAKKGETRKIAELSAKRVARMGDHEKSNENLMGDARLSVVLTGPYGERTLQGLPSDSNILCIAGGTGITYVLPVLLDMASRPQNPDRHMSLVWSVRRRSDIDWIAPELAVLKAKCRNLRTRIHIYVTRAAEEEDPSVPSKSEKGNKGGCCSNDKEIEPVSSSTSSSASASSVISMHGVSKAEVGLNHYQARPDLATMVTEFVAGTVRGRTDVFASGPGGMISDLRSIVASSNRGGEVWKGEERWDVRLISDDRLEW